MGHTGLIGFNPRRLQGPKSRMSSHATDLSVYAKSSSSDVSDFSATDHFLFLYSKPKTEWQAVSQNDSIQRRISSSDPAEVATASSNLQMLPLHSCPEINPLNPTVDSTVHSCATKTTSTNNRQ